MKEVLNEPEPVNSLFLNKGFLDSLTYVTYGSIAASVVGMVFLKLSFPGASTLLVAGLCTLATVLFFQAFLPSPADLPKDKVALYSIAKTLGGVGAATGCIAALFVLLQFPGAKALATIGGAGSAVALLFSFYPAFRPYSQLRNPGLIVGSFFGIAVWLTPPAALYAATHPDAENREAMLYEEYFHGNPNAEKAYLEFMLEKYQQDPENNSLKIERTKAQLEGIEKK